MKDASILAVKVFIDGQEGTTGLRILERFSNRNDIELIKIDNDKRKDINERKKLINQSEYTFLCLPDAAAKESVSLVENDHVKILDASTAHRTNDAWVYGFPELSLSQREKIRTSKRLAVPGCYASGFISLVHPLIKAGIMQNDFPVFAYATSGYSGAGKKAIAVYESDEKPSDYNSPRQYALTQAHKHLPEMQKISGLCVKPMFNPIVCDYYSGMVVSVPVQTRMLSCKHGINDIYEALSKHYEGQKMVSVMPPVGDGILPDGFLASNTMSNSDKMQIFVFGNDDQVLLCSRFDNLGKGASGAAVECLNIMMGIDETTGLNIF